MNVKYRAVSAALLDDPNFQKLPSYTRWVYVVLTATLGPSGVEERYPQALIQELLPRIGGTARKISQGLEELQALGWIRREGRLVWAVRQLEQGSLMTSANPKHVACITGQVDALPDSQLTRDFREHYGEWWEKSDSHLNRYRKTINRLSVGYRTTETETDTEDRGRENGRLKKEDGDGRPLRAAAATNAVGVSAADPIQKSTARHAEIEAQLGPRPSRQPG